MAKLNFGRRVFGFSKFYLGRKKKIGKNGNFIHGKMSVWNKQNWIKDILSKSGTEITEINEDKAEGLFLFKFFEPQ